MALEKKVKRAVKGSDRLPPPVISDDGQLIASFYQIAQFGSRRLGFAVLNAADQLQAGSLSAVAEGDPAAVARLRDSAKMYLSDRNWREMDSPDWSSFNGNHDSMQWKRLNLTVTVTHEGNLWFSHSDSGHVIGTTPFASRLIESRGCSVNMMYHNLVFNDVAGFDPKTRLAFLGFDIIESDRDSPYFSPFQCDPSALVHVVKVSSPDQRNY